MVGVITLLLTIGLVSESDIQLTGAVSHDDPCVDDGHDGDHGDCDDVDAGGGEHTADYCGDGICTDTEKYANDPCPADCCGDGYCSPYEDQYCPNDCSEEEPDPVVETYPPCDPGDIAVCHEDCSCLCEAPSYSGSNFASNCPNAPEETPLPQGANPDEYDAGISHVNAPFPEVDFLDGVVIVEFAITNYNAPTAVNWDVELHKDGTKVDSQTGDTATLGTQESESMTVTFSGKSAGTYGIDIVVAPNEGGDVDSNDNQFAQPVFVTIRESTDPEVTVGREGPTVGTNPVVDDPIDMRYDGGILEVNNVVYDSGVVTFNAVILNYADPTSFDLDLVVADSSGANLAESSATTSIFSSDEQQTFNGVIAGVLAPGEYYVAVQLTPTGKEDADPNDNIAFSNLFTISAAGDVTNTETPPTGVDIAVTSINVPQSANIDSTVDFTFTIQSDGELSDAGLLNYGFGIYDEDENVLYNPEETKTLTNGEVSFSFNAKSIGLATDTQYYMAAFAGPLTLEDSDPTNNVILGTNFAGQFSEDQIDPSLTIKFTGTKTVATVIPKATTKITTITKPTTKKVTKKKIGTKTTPGKKTKVNLVPQNGIKGPPKLLTEKPFSHGMYGGTLIESPVSGKLTPSLDALYPVNPDMIGGLTRQAAQCIIDNAPRWVMYTYDGKKLIPTPTGEAVEVRENEGLVVAISQDDGCQLEGVFTSKPKANPLQLDKEGWNLYAMQPELEGKKLTDLQCPLGTKVTEAYSLQSGEWTEISDWTLRDGASGNLWWTQSVFVRCG